MRDQRPQDRPATGDTIPLRTPPPLTAPPARPARAPAPGPLMQPARRRSLRRWVRLIGWLLIATLLAGLIGLIVLQQRVARTVALADVRTNRPPAMPLVLPMNILLLGVDLRADHPEEGIRSDTIMLLRLDPGGAWASLLSIPRDSVATIPGFGQAKINAAFQHGYANAEQLYGPGTEPLAAGAALAADTVEQFLNLPAQGQRIHYVATINFEGFARMIDAVGGIEVDVPVEIVDEAYPTDDFGYTTLHIPAGRQQMDGATALKYVRTRHADSDFGRAQRQQQVLQALVAALREQPLLLRPFVALRLVDAAGAATRTTLPVGRPDALLLAALLTRLDPASIQQVRITPDSVAVQEQGSDLIWDQAGLQALVQQWLRPPGEEQEQATLQVLNGAGVSGLAGRVSEELRAQGFTVSQPGNAELTPTSRIIDYGDHPATRRRLSRVLGGLPVSEGSSSDAPQGVDIVVILGQDYQRFWRER